MSNHNQTEKITLELTKEQSEFLNWAAKLEGVSAEDYLLRAVKGQIYKSGEPAGLKELQPGGNASASHLLTR
jgi:hypothetical protein